MAKNIFLTEIEGLSFPQAATLIFRRVNFPSAVFLWNGFSKAAEEKKGGKDEKEILQFAMFFLESFFPLSLSASQL